MRQRRSVREGDVHDRVGVEVLQPVVARSRSSRRSAGLAWIRLCAVEQVSWRKPGSVSSSVAVSPPRTGRASSTQHLVARLARGTRRRRARCGRRRRRRRRSSQARTILRPWPGSATSTSPRSTDPELLADMEHSRLYGTPRPETQAIRFHVPAVAKAFMRPWKSIFRAGDRRALPQGALPRLRLEDDRLRLLRVATVSPGRRARAGRGGLRGAAELRALRPVQRAAEGGAALHEHARLEP